MTHPFTFSAVEITDLSSVTVVLKHPDYARFSYQVEASFEFLRRIDGGMPRQAVGDESGNLERRLLKSKITCEPEEMVSGVVDAFTRLVTAYRSMLPDTMPNCWNTPGLDDPRGRKRSVA